MASRSVRSGIPEIVRCTGFRYARSTALETLVKKEKYGATMKKSAHYMKILLSVLHLCPIIRHFLHGLAVDLSNVLGLAAQFQVRIIFAYFLENELGGVHLNV